jgi:hypothetical protein
MGALRVAFERREPSNSLMEFTEVLGLREIMNVVENLDTFNFYLAESLIHRIHAGIVGGCVDRSQAEGIAGFASRGHGATNGDASLQARAPDKSVSAMMMCMR